MTKELIYEDKNQTKWLLDNGLTQVTYRKTKDSEAITMTYASYWHPYELRHYMRDYASYSPISYVRLGQKIKSLGLCIEGNDESWDLRKLIPAIAKHISLNAKPFLADGDKRTVKQIYGTREAFLKRLRDSYERELNAYETYELSKEVA